MERLFNFRPEGLDVTLNENTTVKLMAIRKGPRGIVAVLKDFDLVVLWDKENAETHLQDTQEEFVQRLIDIKK